MSNRVVKLDTKAARELLTTEREREGVAWEPIDISSLPADVKNLLKEDSEREKLYQAVAKLVEPRVTVPPGKEISVNYIPARLQYGFVNPKKKKVIKQALRLARPSTDEHPKRCSLVAGQQWAWPLTRLRRARAKGMFVALGYHVVSTGGFRGPLFARRAATILIFLYLGSAVTSAPIQSGSVNL